MARRIAVRDRSERGEEIRLLRGGLGLSKTDFANKTNVSGQSVTNWEDGGVMKPENLARVAHVLGVHPSELCAEGDDIAVC